MPGTPILIVDDEPSVIEGIKELLEDEGYEVHQAFEAKEGLKIFREMNPEVVVTDLKMVGMSGMELIGNIRKINELTPIIVVTGYGTLNSAIDAIRLDVFDFITKPIDVDTLKSTIDRACETLRKTQDIQREMTSLREQLALFQLQWQDQLAKYSEVEPLIHTGRLLAGVLHNLNNPLTYIMGQAELLQVLHPEVENIDIIQEQAIRMKKIMSTIMKRMKAAQIRQLEWLQLNEILEEEVFFLESHPYFRVDIEKEWHLAPDLPLFKGVAAEFSQIFGNLLRNAAEAMKGQSVKRLIIRTWNDETGIHLSIEDSGPGVPVHLREKIFEPFFSTKTADPSASGGMGMGIGIGLFHCKELIHQYGGRLEVESRPTEGANFLIHLPRISCKPVSERKAEAKRQGCNVLTFPPVRQEGLCE